MNTSVQKRARQQLSCTACRTGKLRCNRRQPCDQCIKRSKDSTCQYLAAPPKKKQNRNTKDRIAHLEGLVVQLMNRDGSSASSTSPQSQGGNESSASTSERQSSSGTSISKPVENDSPGSSSENSQDSSSHAFGQLKISNGKASYRGATHWEAILGSIAEVKESLEDEDDTDEDEEGQATTSTSVLLLGSPTLVTKEYLLQSVPPKPVADRLLWHWFNSTDPGLPSVHRPTFLAQYDRLWIEPAETPTMWLALLFSIMSLGARIAAYNFQMDPKPPALGELDSPDHYQSLAGSALALADYTKPKRHTIEALMAHASCEYMKHEHGSLKLWLLMAVILRVALRMGYHRDGSHFPNIGAFETEMRRRVWYLAYVFDVLQSYELGLPSMIQQVQSDTKRPSNLLDTDFGPDSNELPAPRPLTELSPVSYSIVKHSLTKVFSKACDLSHAVQAPEYEEIMALDKELQQVSTETPPALRFVSMNQSILDPPALIFNRFKLELMFQKTRCVLHRRYLIDEVVGTRQELSRKLCVEAALSLLKQHETIYLAAQDGGQLSAVRFFLASLNSNDFLLAAMVLCLELDLISRACSPATAGPNQDRVDEIRQIIEISYNIYKKPINHSAETDRAVKAMEVMLRKIKPAKGLFTDGLDNAYANDASTNSVVSQQTPVSNGMLDPTLQMADMSMFEGIFSPGQDMDWQAWDKIIQNNPDPDLSLNWSPDIGVNGSTPLEGFTDGTIDPSFSLLGQRAAGSDLSPDLVGCGVMPFQRNPPQL